MLQRLPQTQVVAVEGTKRYTVGELLNESERIALALHQQGVRRGTRILIAMEPGWEFLKNFLSLLHLRALTSIIDPQMGNALYQSLLKQFDPAFAMIDSRLLLLQEHPLLRWAYKLSGPAKFYIPYSSNYRVIATGRKLPLFQKHTYIRSDSSALKPIWIKEEKDEEVLVVYTAGTLSDPKGVVHSIDTLFHSLQAIAGFLNADTSQRLATHLPHFALLGMMSGFETHFWQEAWPAEKKIRFIETNTITTLFAPPAEYKDLMEYCIRQHQKLPSCLSHLLIGSAPVLKGFLLQLRQLTRARITCTYGMTENLIVSIVDGDEKIQNEQEGDLLGKPLQGIEYDLTEEGELVLRSPWKYKKYLSGTHDREWHPTGDLVKKDVEGNLYMLGRKKNMIIRRNKNIYPGLYEPTISAIPGVKDCVLFGVYDEQEFDEKLILAVDTNPGITRSQIVKQLQSGKYSIDADCLPDHIMMGAIPKKGRQQKADLEKLKELYEAV